MIKATPGKIICKEVDEDRLVNSLITLVFMKKQKPLAGIVTSCGGVYYNQKGKTWHCPVSVGDLVFFKKVGPVRHDGRLFAWFEDVIGRIPEGGHDV